MASVANLLIDRLAAAYQQDRRLVLAFDYDGTLTPFAARPELARLDPALRGVLARLAATPRVTVGVISGRVLADVKRMVGLPGLHYGGTLGLELDLRGRRLGLEPAAPPDPVVNALIAATEARLPAYPGAWVEKKAWGLTLHYRQAHPDQIGALQAEFMALLEPHAAALRVFQASTTIEVFLERGTDKGTALRAMIAHGDFARSPYALYAGDAANDAAALAAATELGGIALGIGPEPPAEAVYHLADPAALSAFLALLAKTLTAVRSIA